jgi:aspartokinase
VPDLAGAGGFCAVATLANVVLVSIESAGLELCGTQVTERASDAIACVNVEPLLRFTSPLRQHGSFLVRSDELERVVQALESALASDFERGCLQPIQVDHDVALLAVVGKGTQDKSALANRISAAILRVQVNIVAIIQDSTELTIAVVVQRDGLERAVVAVHAECRLGPNVPAPPAGLSGSMSACLKCEDGQGSSGIFRLNRGSEANP